MKTLIAAFILLIVVPAAGQTEYLKIDGSKGSIYWTTPAPIFTIDTTEYELIMYADTGGVVRWTKGRRIRVGFEPQWITLEESWAREYWMDTEGREIDRKRFIFLKAKGDLIGY